MLRKPPHKENFFCVGVITTAHGIKGEVLIKPFTETPKNMTEYGTLVNMHDVPFSFLSFKIVKKGVIAKLEGVHSRNEAEALRGTCLYASDDKLPALDDSDMYLDDLIGVKLYREDKTLFGTIRSHFDNGAHTIIAVKMPTEGKKDVLLPFTGDVILKVNHDKKEIIVSEMAEEFEALEG